jgi:cell division protein FtsZ
MIEFELEKDIKTPPQCAVSVVGVGGSGINVIDRIALEGMPGADIIAMASDVRILNNSMATHKLQLGAALTQGLGAGGDPELGLEAAQASGDEIRELLAGRSMVFICTGLGGGTCSGAAPYIAKLAREAGAFVVVFATMPFTFEGRRRQKQASMALEQLRAAANALITFDNDRMGELVVPKKGIQEAFQLADKIIGQSVRAVTSLVTQPGLIRIGMDDLMTALRNTDSRCLFGFGQAKGDNRALESLTQALKSPLLDRGQMLAKAHNVLVHICGGDDMTLFEIQTLMSELQKHVNEDAHLLFGAASDAKLGEHLTVTIVTSLGLEGSTVVQSPRTIASTEPPRPVFQPPVGPLTPPPTAGPSDGPVAKQRPVEALKDAAAPASRSTTILPTAKLEAPPVAAEPPRRPAAPPPAAVDEEEEEDDNYASEPPVLARGVISKPAPTPTPTPTPAPVLEEEDEEDEDEAESEADEETPVAEQPAPQEVQEQEQEEEDDDEEEVAAPPPPKKFAIRDILMKPKAEPGAEQNKGARPSPFIAGDARSIRGVTPSNTVQQSFEERLDGGNRGHFAKTSPNVEGDEDLDVPTFLRKQR